MKSLLDTNVFLWFISGKEDRLSINAIRHITDLENELVLSVASLWEIAMLPFQSILQISYGKDGFFNDSMAVQIIIIYSKSQMEKLFKRVV